MAWPRGRHHPRTLTIQVRWQDKAKLWREPITTLAARPPIYEGGSQGRAIAAITSPAEMAAGIKIAAAVAHLRASSVHASRRPLAVSDKQLHHMLACASEFCELCFAKAGAIEPTWHAVTSKGENFVEPARADFDTAESLSLIHVLFELRDVVRYMFIHQAWTLAHTVPAAEMDRISRQGLAEHPDRLEVVMLQGEDRDCGQIVAQRRVIRPAHRQPYLGPLETMEDVMQLPPGAAIAFHGQLVGLLPVHGTRH